MQPPEKAPQYGPLVWFFIWCLNASCVTLSHYMRLRKQSEFVAKNLPLLLSMGCIGLPFFLPNEEITLRGVVSLAAGFYAVKTREVITEPRFDKEPLWIKISSVVAFFFDKDERAIIETASKKRKKLLKQAAVFAFHICCQVLFLELFQQRGNMSRRLFPGNQLYIHYSRVVIGCITACLFTFFSLHVYGDALLLIWLLFGIRFPPLMDAPEKSLSVREFWKRWNTVVQKLLMKYVFEPARKAGMSAHLAIALTFFASGLIHVFPIFVAKGYDWVAASSMMAYFIVQYSVMVLERPLNVSKWNPWVARIWTIFHLFGPSYLLVYPVLRTLDLEF
jgi:hypothetical protein